MRANTVRACIQKYHVLSITAVFPLAHLLEGSPHITCISKSVCISMKKLLIFSAKKYRPYFRRKHDTRILLWAKTTHFSSVAPSADLELHNIHGGKCSCLKLQTFNLFWEKISSLFFENELQKGRENADFDCFARKSRFSSRNMHVRIFSNTFSESTRNFGSRKHLLIVSSP